MLSSTRNRMKRHGARVSSQDDDEDVEATAGLSEPHELIALIAKKQEEWESFREGWERYHNMDLVAPKIVQHFEAGTINVGCNMVLTQGIDATVTKFTGVMQNFAVTAALMMTMNLAFMVDMPDDLPRAWLWVYIVCLLMGMMCQTTCIVAAIHFLNMVNRFRCDADAISYFLDHDWMKSVMTLQMVVPLIVGIICFWPPALIFAGNILGYLNWSLLILIPGALVVTWPLYSWHTSGPVFDKYYRYGNTDELRHVVAMYAEMGELAKKLDDSQKQEADTADATEQGAVK